MSESFGYMKKISIAVLMVGGGLLFTKGFSLLKEMLIAAYFGRSDGIEAYMATFALLNFLYMMVGNSISIAATPFLVETRKKNGLSSFNRLLTQTSLLMLAAGLVLTFLAVSLKYQLFSLISPGFDTEKRLMMSRMLYAMIPLVLTGPLVQLWTSSLNSLERFALPSFFNSFIPVSIIIILLAYSNNFREYSIAYGTGVGITLQLLFLALYLKKQGFSFELGKEVHPQLTGIISKAMPLLGAAMISGGTILVDTSMASLAKGKGVSSIGYGYKPVALYLSIVSIAISTALLPYLSMHAIDEDKKKTTTSILSLLDLTALLSLPSFAIFYLFNSQIIKILFEHGTFSHNDTIIVASIMKIYAFMIPIYVIGRLWVQALQSHKRTAIPAFTGVLNFFSNMLFNWLFMKYLGVKGIALSTVFVYIVSFTIMMLASSKIFSIPIISIIYRLSVPLLYGISIVLTGIFFQDMIGKTILFLLFSAIYLMYTFTKNPFLRSILMKIKKAI